MTVKKNKMIDCFKGIACLFVIFIHCRLPYRAGHIVVSMARFSVPFFFAVSGFYLINWKRKINYENIKSKAINKVKRYIKIFFVVFAVYYVYGIFHCLIVGDSVIQWLNSKFSIGNIISLLVFNHSFTLSITDNCADHLWFLLAMIYAYIIIFFIARKLEVILEKLTVILCFMLYSLQWMCRGKMIHIFDVSINAQICVINFLFDGLFFILLGICISKYQNKLGGISIFNIRLLPVFFITSIIERICFGELDVYLSSMAIVIIILVNANKIQVTHFDGLQFIGGNLSSNIYYYHVLIKLITKTSHT